MQEQREIVKQDKSDGLAIKVHNLQFLLKGSRHYSEPNPFQCFAATEPPTRWETLSLLPNQRVEPRAVEARRLIMLTPAYLSPSQSKKCALADHTHFEPLL